MLRTSVTILGRVIGQALEKARTAIAKQTASQVLFVVIVALILVTNLRLIDITSQLNNRLQDLANSSFPLGAPQSRPLTDVVVDVSWEGAPVRGPVDAPIQIVEFSDFQCPYCAASIPVLERVFEKYEGQVLLAYRHFPLPSHPQAMPAAEAAECAREQGKFWEMHDLIFENQITLNLDSYRNFAQRLQLDLAQFDSCLSEHRYEDVILNDLREGKSYGVNGTPTFFINGHVIPGSADLATFQQIIEEVMASKKSK